MSTVYDRPPAMWGQAFSLPPPGVSRFCGFPDTVREERFRPCRRAEGAGFLALTAPNPRYNEGRRPFRLHVAER
jgi:hypothetical protein